MHSDHGRSCVFWNQQHDTQARGRLCSCFSSTGDVPSHFELDYYLLTTVYRNIMATGGLHLSKEFFELLKAIGESKSKQEEDRIIMKEIQRLKAKMEGPKSPSANHSGGVNPLVNSKKRAKEFLVRLLYVEMLGHDASFGWIKAVELAASSSLFHKRTGYLVCGACLPPTHEFRFMLVNQMQRDLQSTNVLETSGGILACTQIITADMVPAVSSEVIKLLGHDAATIRKKAIVALYRFHQLADEVVSAQEMQDFLRKILCDKDPSAMGASLNIIEVLASKYTAQYKDLVPSLVSILKQIIDHRLPSEYDYHRVPAPWMQLKLVRILGILGRADSNASNGMYEILHETMKKADNGINAGYAIVYECIKTIVSIYPNPKLLDAAGEAISRFMQSRAHNLKYLGVTGLALIVEEHPQYAAQHQLAVMDCLEDPDETLQRKTLDLLYRMTNPVNIEFISEKLIVFLSSNSDPFLKSILTQRVCNIAERYAPDNAWYIRTITKLFEVSGDMVEHEVAQNMMSLIAEGTGESDEADMLLRQNAVEIYVGLLRDKPAASLPRILLETMAWCLGEYGYLSAVSTLDDVLHQLCELASLNKSKLSPSSRRFLVTAIMKLVAQAGNCPSHAAAVIDDYTRSKDPDLQQRCLEFQQLLTNCPHLLPEILPVDASAEDLEVDESMSFLNGYVQEALQYGASPYCKPEDDDDEDYDQSHHSGSGFNLTPYEKPQNPTQAMRAMSGLGAAGRSSSQSVSLPPGGGASEGGSTVPINLEQPAQLSLNTRNMANKWGKGGLSKPAANAPAAAPPSANAWNNVPTAASAVSSASSSVGVPSYATPVPAAAPEKTAEQLEKERQAAALFGGIVPGAPVRTPAPAPVAPPPQPKPKAVPPKASAPAPAMDLLDLSGWENTAPSASVASAPMSGNSDFDVFADTHSAAGSVSAASPHVRTASLVETVSEDGEDEEVAQAVAPQVQDEDPFASAGLLGEMDQAPLPTLESSQKFEFGGNTLAPMQISTAQFGQQWGACSSTFPVSLISSKVRTLDQFMAVCKGLGAYPVEAIAATNEGICAGMLGGSHVCLIHGKVAGSRVDATVKSTDQSIGSSLAMYLQTMLR